jgi:hypothetical protein
MATPPAPLTGGAVSLNTQEVGFNVRNWVHYDNLATSLYRQTTNARKFAMSLKQRSWTVSGLLIWKTQSFKLRVDAL